MAWLPVGKGGFERLKKLFIQSHKYGGERSYSLEHHAVGKSRENGKLIVYIFNQIDETIAYGLPKRVEGSNPEEVKMAEAYFGIRHTIPFNPIIPRHSG